MHNFVVEFFDVKNYKLPLDKKKKKNYKLQVNSVLINIFLHAVNRLKSSKNYKSKHRELLQLKAFQGIFVMQQLIRLQEEPHRGSAFLLNKSTRK